MTWTTLGNRIGCCNLLLESWFVLLDIDLSAVYIFMSQWLYRDNSCQNLWQEWERFYCIHAVLFCCFFDLQFSSETIFFLNLFISIFWNFTMLWQWRQWQKYDYRVSGNYSRFISRCLIYPIAWNRYFLYKIPAFYFSSSTSIVLERLALWYQHYMKITL